MILDSFVRPRYYYYFNHYQNKYTKNENIAILENDFGKVLLPKIKEYYKKFGASEINPHQLYMYLMSDRQLDDNYKIAIDIEYRLSIIIDKLRIRLRDVSMFLQGVHHVGALRSWPERIYFGTGGKPDYVGTKGEFTQEMFWLDKRIGHDNLIEKINHWLFELKFNVELEVVQVRGDIYQLNVKQNGLSVNMADVGFGLSQILPILVECLNYSLEHVPNKQVNPFEHTSSEQTIKKCIISEQPEIHLNPMIQAQLGDLFIEIGAPDMSIFIETHSEHIINRVQRRVADGTLDPNDVSIYFVSKNQNKSIVKNIKISPNGTFDYWPEGFFQDDYEDSIEILKASLRNAKGE